ncbi:MAG: peptidoglycan DD-metalloendopeptidase family protein [Gammaproteobacteria bacterium]|nr:peptidoglycan DD-metalloendopeptidase family protein [Gammaproteobacteria bacterium]
MYKNGTFCLDLKRLGHKGLGRLCLSWQHLGRVLGIIVATVALWLTSATIAAIDPGPTAKVWGKLAATGSPQAELPRHTDTAITLGTPIRLPALEAPSKQIGPTELGAPGPSTWVRLKVKKGDSLDRIFKRHGLKPHQAHILAAYPLGQAFNRLKPGQHILIRQIKGKLLELRYQLNLAEQLRVKYPPSGYKKSSELTITRHTRQIETRLRHVSGVIHSSLFDAGINAGVSDGLILKMVEIFGWDVDFALDLRRGDSFALVHEEYYYQGEKLKNGGIVAAEFVNQGHIYRAIRHRTAANQYDYYTPEGVTLRRAFLRTPVAFNRISSGFSKGRYHPVLKKWRAHKGVDYAAPRGTAIRATADGKVSLRGRKGGYGKTIILRHGGTYTTLYAHLRGYNKRLRRGQTVKQGDIIGYVGSTGLATGPHLHYEFRVNGRHKNPLTVKHPHAGALASELRRSFQKLATHWESRLNLISRSTAPMQAAQATTARGKADG